MLLLLAVGTMLIGSLIYAVGVRRSSRWMRVLGATVALVPFPIFSLIIWLITVNSDS